MFLCRLKPLFLALDPKYFIILFSKISIVFHSTLNSKIYHWLFLYKVWGLFLFPWIFYCSNNICCKANHQLLFWVQLCEHQHAYKHMYAHICICVSMNENKETEKEKVIENERENTKTRLALFKDYWYMLAKNIAFISVGSFDHVTFICQLS